jgi:hypothetical protein
MYEHYVPDVYWFLTMGWRRDKMGVIRYNTLSLVYL